MTGSGPLTQRLRLWSGLVLTIYVISHYLNASAGHISLAAMEGFLQYNSFVWQSLPGTILLYGAFLVHIGLGLFKLLQMRTWRRPAWEWTQIVLGLAIPWLLLSHVTYTRAAEELIGIEVGYKHELSLLWPEVWVQQSILLGVVWLHACIGIHFWLRIRPWYTRWQPVLLGMGVFIPLLAQTGWITAARRQYDAAAQAAASAASSGAENGAAAAENLAINSTIMRELRAVEDIFQTGALIVVGVVASVMAIRWFVQRFRTRVKVSYGDGTIAFSAPGHTLLEISRASGVPHMSVCGGRARCSTCRTLIVEGLENCAAVTPAESILLTKLNADARVRLACQCIVRGDMQVRPLIQPGSIATAARNVDPLGWGVEREIAVLFLDIRGFSRISEKSLPYDVVFILNSLFGEVGAEIESAHGYIDKFMGDGLMALFGLDSTPAEASRDAIRAAIAAQEACRNASKLLTHHISEPIRIGIGIHTGQAVVGRIGKTSDQTTPSRLTAIGDTVNIAARLESATKELQAGIVVSRRTFDLAGLSDEVGGRKSSIRVHNITEPVDVVAIDDMAPFKTALGVLSNSANPKSRGFLDRRKRQTSKPEAKRQKEVQE